MNQGRIGQYAWAEFSNERPTLLVSAVARQLSRHLVGLHGVNVSWDSALLVKADPGFPSGWSFVGEHAVSPPITTSMADHWPYSSCGFDEWYFFREIPANCRLSAFCNWLGASLAESAEMNFAGGIDLYEQLHATRPELVIGQGYRIYVITANPEVLTDFVGLASEAAQQGDEADKA
jgi:hypothetical protein